MELFTATIIAMVEELIEDFKASNHQILEIKLYKIKWSNLLEAFLSKMREHRRLQLVLQKSKIFEDQMC